VDTSLRDKGLYAFGPFRVDPLKRTLLRDGATVSLSPKVFDTLLYLIENPDRVLGKDELLEAIWPGRIVEEGSLSQSIFALRKALSGPGELDRFIVTAPGRGYRFTAPVQRVSRQTEDVAAPTGPAAADADIAPPAQTPAQIPAPSPPPTAPRSLQRSALPSRSMLLVAALPLLAVGLLYGFLQWRGSPHSTEHNLIVLEEFQNLSPDPAFDQALAKALEIDLVQSPFLTVLPEQQVQSTLLLMTHARDEKLTPALAQEVCARNEGKAVLGGSIAALGQKYLLTLTASACGTGEILAEEKGEADSKEATLATLDGLASGMRARLGESLDSIKRFDVPLQQQRTVSFDALKAYSEGADLYGHGKRAESIPLFQHAIELDPDFAAAYADLAAVYNSLTQSPQDTDNIAKAYALRDGVGEREKLLIVSRYHQILTRDFEETIRNFQVWAETYPQDSVPWTNLSNAENWVGRYADAIEAGKRALALNPDKEASYVVLCRAYKHANQFALAQAACEEAVTRGLAGDDTHGQLLELAYARRDDAAVAAEIAWAKGKPAERNILLKTALIAYSQGRIAQGDSLFQQVVAQGAQQGLSNFTAAPNARILLDFGMEQRAHTLLDSVPAGFDSADYLFATAEIGDVDRLQEQLRKDLQQRPADTLLNQVFAPETRAALALRRGQPAAAVTELQPALLYELRTYDVPYVRGRAYLAAGDGANAAVEFRKILDNPGVEPISHLYDLSLLGLARAERLEGKLAACRGDYEKFFAAWKNADPDVPILQQARLEYSKL